MCNWVKLENVANGRKAHGSQVMMNSECHAKNFARDLEINKEDFNWVSNMNRFVLRKDHSL